MIFFSSEVFGTYSSIEGPEQEKIKATINIDIQIFVFGRFISGISWCEKMLYDVKEIQSIEQTKRFC